MADGSMTAANSKVAEIVLGLLAKRAFEGPLEMDRNLLEAGLTSLDMVNLMLAVEAEFDIEIPNAMMKPEHFRTVQAIEALVATVTG